MSAATIGQGAVVLTANADRLLSGLDRARTATNKWAGDVGKGAGKAAKAGGGGGGLFGGLMFGGGAIGAGGPAGLALAAVGALGKPLEKFVEHLASVRERAQKYMNVGAPMSGGIERAAGAFDRISGAYDEFLFRVAGKLAPYLEKAADVLERVGFVGAEVFGEMVDLIAEVVTSIAQWVDETFGLATATTSAGDQAFAVLRNIGTGVAYLWDTAKAGAGAVAVAAGYVVTGFGKVLDVVALAAKELDALARELPEAIRPDWVGKAAAAVEGFAGKVGGVGEGMQKWGKDAINGFGGAAQQFNKWFDGVEARFQATDRLVKKWEGNFLGGAFQQNSTEAYSVVAKFQAGNKIADGQKRMEALARQQVAGIQGINEKLAGIKAG